MVPETHDNYPERYCAFIDILGFGSLIERVASEIVRIDGAARQELDAQQCLRTARFGACRARPFLVVLSQKAAVDRC
jgi:hypothetical protein